MRAFYENLLTQLLISYNITIALVITVVATAVITYILSLKFEKGTEEETKKPEGAAEQPQIKETAETVVYSPLTGKVLPLAEAKDEAFASGVLGKRVVIEPVSGDVVAPFDGTLVTLFPTKHALGLVSDDGAEVLIHIGIDTVQLNGEHFEAFAEQGQQVKKGQLLVRFDLEKIREKGYCTQVPILITNSNNYSEIQETEKSETKPEEQILVLKR